MNIQNQTVLITGGGSGIGFAIAQELAAQHNKVLLVGRNKAKLDKAASYLPGAVALACDVNDAQQVKELIAQVERDYPQLSMLINNAGQAYAYFLSATAGAYEKAAEEFQTNVLSVIRLTEGLLPVLSRQKEAAIVNVTSVVVYTPVPVLPTYSASKAALHAYTENLRLTLAKESAIKVFEVYPPLVDTELAKDFNSDKISPERVATEVMEGLAGDRFDIRVEKAAGIYEAQLQAQLEVLQSVN
jgi:uncharacterized oxidoreductase